MFERTVILHRPRRLTADKWKRSWTTAVLQALRTLAQNFYHAGIVTEEQWFELSIKQRTSDIVVAYALTEEPSRGTFRRRETLLIDLRASDATIWNGIDKGGRYEIRRAEKEGLAVQFYTEIPDDVIMAFADAYELLRTRKALPPLRFGRLRGLISSGILRISTCAEHDGEVLSWHIYVVRGTAVRLLHSVSLFDMGDSPARKAKIGRANRIHHWRDILEFKRQGLYVYDFGGIYLGETDQAQKSIATFKRQFGGVRRTVYDVAVPMTWRGHIAVFLRRSTFHKH